MKVVSNVMPPFDAHAVAAKFIEHGGRVSVARAQYPDAPSPWLDLSTGISPWPYPIPKLPVECWTRLPDPADLARLTAAARSSYQAPDQARILPVAGTDLAIAILPRLVGAARNVAIVAPTYGAHEKAWAAAGHRVTLVAGLNEVANCDVAVVVNPNNPGGQRWPRAPLFELAADLRKRDGLLIIDEAFSDSTPGVSILSAGADLSNVIVLRSFGKFYGLAGVRLGFVVTAHPIGPVLAGTLSEWPVSGPAIEIGSAALADGAWSTATIAKLENAAGRLDAVLEAGGFSVTGGTPLFRLASHPDGWRMFDNLARRGILVRPIQSGETLRFGIPGQDEDFSRLTSALAS